jgi:hypothetical protein
MTRYDNERDYMFEGAISERDYMVEQSMTAPKTEMRRVVFEYLQDRKLDMFLEDFSDETISDMYIEINRWRD